MGLAPVADEHQRWQAPSFSTPITPTNPLSTLYVSGLNTLEDIVDIFNGSFEDEFLGLGCINSIEMNKNSEKMYAYKYCMNGYV